MFLFILSIWLRMLKEHLMSSLAHTHPLPMDNRSAARTSDIASHLKSNLLLYSSCRDEPHGRTIVSTCPTGLFPAGGFEVRCFHSFPRRGK